MNTHALILLLSLFSTAAEAQVPGAARTGAAWVQATASGYEVRAVPEYDRCPTLYIDNQETAMDVRADANSDFPRVCAARLPKNVRSLRYANLAPQSPGPGCVDNGEVCVSPFAIQVSLPIPAADPQRILVLGDTGCRVQGANLQACNDPKKWPFPQLAAAAAALKPDLVIHVGDYLYRESPCPAADAGCAGTPWGDNWITWQADFYAPATPLLAAAPIVLVRGNHEDCVRAGPGWQRLQGPGAAADTCVVHQPLYTVALGGLTLAVLDDAVSNETDLNRDTARVYAEELAGLAKAPAPVWFVHHRPTWAAITGPLGIPIGGNLTLIEASRINSMEGAPLMPATVELMLSGHIHTFEAINFTKGVPPQIVAGNGGDKLDVTPTNLRGAQFLGHSGVTVADGLSVGGFGFLLMTKAQTGWTIDLYDSAGIKTRTCRFTKGRPGRLDCPA